jgi:hypothetical protein
MTARDSIARESATARINDRESAPRVSDRESASARNVTLSAIVASRVHDQGRDLDQFGM